jgi:hypothetical protein
MPHQSRPSKQFLIRGAIAIGIVAFILLIQTNWLHTLFQKKKSVSIAPAITLGDITSKDSNGNGIPDWEETLWGLDPTVLYTNGVSNKEIIDGKKKSLGVTSTTTGMSTNETDAIAQKLFGITTALSQNSTVDDASLQKIANQLGSSVNVASVGNSYALKNIHTVATSPASLTAYYKNITAVMNKANLNQEDVTIIVAAAETGDYSQLSTLTQTGVAYTALAKQLSTIAVPIGVAQYHLDIINSFAGMATSFTYLQQMPDNGTQALVGVALYKVYSSRGQSAFYNLHDYLVKYGILSS